MVTRIPLCLLVTFSLASGQSFVRDFAKEFARDQRHIWTSPFRMDQRQFWTAAVPLIGGTIALKSVDRRITEALPNTPDQFLWSSRVSRIGSGYGLGMAVGSTAVYGAVRGKRAAKEMGLVGLRALGDSLAVTYAIKLVTWRERPDVPNSRGSFWSGGSSFPSGHSMASFAVATAVARHRNCPKWLAITLYATAATVSLSRISSDRHYAADIYFGGFSGILIGNMIANSKR